MALSFDRIKKNIARKRVKNLLRRPSVYAITQKMLRRNIITLPYKATAEMLDFALEKTKKAYRTHNPSVWSNAFFPTELLYALDITPFSPEAAAAVVASIGQQEDFLSEAESKWWSRDNCSFHRCAMGAFYSGFFPLPDAFCSTTHLCDSAVFAFNNLSQSGERPFLLIDVPPTRDENSLNYVKAQLHKIVPLLEDLSARNLELEKLEEAVANVELGRQAMIRLNNVRRNYRSPFTPNEAFIYLYLYFTGLGSPELPRIYNLLADEIQEKIDNGEGLQENPRIRLLWLHLYPFYNSGILHYLESKGVRVVFEEFSHVYWGEMNPARPLDSIAERLLSHFNYGHVEDRVNVIKELAEAYEVDGVVHFTHWCCRQSSGSLDIVKDKLRRKGIPFLILDGDCIDGRNYASGQLQTRIDSFIEMLS